jgi:hypothetical protein
MCRLGTLGASKRRHLAARPLTPLPQSPSDGAFSFARHLCRICNQIAPAVWYGIARGRGGGLLEAELLELLTIQPARIVIGATVFLMGILSGAGIAMWVMPPV